MKKLQTIDMINGPLLKNIFLFTIPLMLTSLLQMMFNTADTIVVGRFAGKQALAAVGSTGSIVFLLTGLFNGLSTGANVVIARYVGSHDDKKVSLSVHTAIFIAIVGGLMMSVLGIVGGRTLLSIMSTPDDIINLSSLYITIYFAGIISLIVYNFGAAILRAVGDTKRPLYYLSFSGVLNVTLNLIFVIVFKMSVAGVALATIISQSLAALLVIKALCEEKSSIRLDLKNICFDKEIAFDIIKIGVPIGLQGMFFSFSNLIIQSTLNSFNDSSIIAGNSAAISIENFVYIGMMAFNNACITFTSQNVGAKQYHKIRRIMLTSLVLIVSSAFLVGFTGWYFGDILLSFYSNDSFVIEIGKIRLFYVVLFLFLNGVLDAFLSSMRGMGISTTPTILMLIGIVGVRMIWIFMIFPLNPTIEMIYLCFPVSWIITSIIECLCWIYVHNNFIKKYA